MPFNAKTRRAITLWEDLLSKPAGHRHGMTWFWLASLPRVRAERLVRVAHLPERRFVFEAEIDAGATHMMTSSRVDEYVAHERVMFSGADPDGSIDDVAREVRNCIAQGRIVVAFHDARALNGATNHTGSNPVWYTHE